MMFNFLVNSDSRIVVMTDNGKVLEAGLKSYLSGIDPYEARVELLGPLSGLFDSEFDLRDKICIYEGTCQECIDFAKDFAEANFQPLVSITKSEGTERTKCPDCGEYTADDTCTRCIKQKHAQVDPLWGKIPF